jgi:hypothetical protein
VLNTLPPPVSHRRGIFLTQPVKALGGFITQPIPNMTNPLNPTPAPPPRLALDQTCNQIIAALTHRLAEAAAQWEHPGPSTNHDFLLPVIDPDLATAAPSWINEA